MIFNVNNRNAVSDNTNKDVVWKQYFVSICASLPFFTYGVENDIITASSSLGPIISNLSVPWCIVAYIVSSLITTPLHCYILNKHGSKVGIYIVVLLQGVVCIPLLISSRDISVLIQASIAGISTGGLFIVIPIYIREISSDRIRGLTVSFMAVMVAGGNTVKLLMSIDTTLYFIIGLVAVELAIVFYIPESPSYLVKIDKLQEAKLTTAKLKCIQDDTYVTNEIQRLKEESEAAKSKGNLNIFGIIKNKTWRDQLKMGLFLNTAVILSGSVIFLDQDKMLAQLKTEADPQKMLIPISLLIGGFTCVVLIKFLERKYLLTIAYSIMVLSMGTLAVYTQADLTVTSVRWIPVVALAILVFSYGIVWNLPTVILVEMLNLEIRTTIVGIVYVYIQVIKLIHVLTLRYIEDYVGIYTMLYLFACINIFGAIYAISMLPYIKDKTVKQIERQLRRVPLLKL